MSETSGRCRSEMEEATAVAVAYAALVGDAPAPGPIQIARVDLVLADAIDRLAADVAAVKEAVCDIAPGDSGRFVPSELEWDELVDRKTAAIRERDEARAEVTRLRTELEAAIRAIRELRAETVERQPAAVPQPATVSDAQAAMDRDRAFVQRYCAAQQAAVATPVAPHFSRSSMMTEEASLDELQMLVHTWAGERKILSDSSPQAQLVKLTEEVGELAAGVCRDDQQKIIDSIGDTAVVLIVMCGILRVSFRRCLQAAYDEIKGRSGTIEGGVFVKTSDAAPQPADGNSPEKLDSSPAAPQPAAPPAGWLTEEEREHLSRAVHFLRRYGLFNGAQTIEAILARAGSPPVVEVPVMRSCGDTAHEEARAYRAALDNAGVKWREVGRE